jgi:hypothetical protein
MRIHDALCVGDIDVAFSIDNDSVELSLLAT